MNVYQHALSWKRAAFREQTENQVRYAGIPYRTSHRDPSHESGFRSVANRGSGWYINRAVNPLGSTFIDDEPIYQTA